MDQGAEKLECARQQQGFCSQPSVRESEDAEVKIALVWAPMSVRDAPTGSEEQHDPSGTVETRNLPRSEVRMGQDLMVIIEKRQNKSEGL